MNSIVRAGTRSGPVKEGGRQENAKAVRSGLTAAFRHFNFKPLAERFWKYVDRRGPDECWMWTGSRRGEGMRYGSVAIHRDENPNGVKGHTDGAHRVSWAMANGRGVPGGLFVLHSCDVKLCVNPAHLRIGTHAENMEEMVEKGRQNKARGERCRHAKIDCATAIRIKSMLDEKSNLEIAREIGITPKIVSDIRRGITWRHV
jgi:hypothetical protein